MGSMPGAGSNAIRANSRSEDAICVNRDESKGSLQENEPGPPPGPPQYPENPEPVSAMALYQACNGVMADLFCSIGAWADHYEVPDELVIEIVTDRLVSRDLGVEPTPTHFFLPEDSEAGS